MLKIITHQKLVDRQFRKGLAVHLDAERLEAVHETAVVDAFFTTGRIDADDPQLAEHRLLLAAVAVGVLLGPVDCMLGIAEEPGGVGNPSIIPLRPGATDIGPVSGGGVPRAHPGDAPAQDNLQ